MRNYMMERFLERISLSELCMPESAGIFLKRKLARQKKNM